MCFPFLGEPWGPLTSFTFSQKDMCLVFVAFATWAVRTSDLHTPDAWKTGLGALGGVGTVPRSGGASRGQGAWGTQVSSLTLLLSLLTHRSPDGLPLALRGWPCRCKR